MGVVGGERSVGEGERVEEGGRSGGVSVQGTMNIIDEIMIGYDNFIYILRQVVIL